MRMSDGSRVPCGFACATLEFDTGQPSSLVLVRGRQIDGMPALAAAMTASSRRDIGFALRATALRLILRLAMPLSFLSVAFSSLRLAGEQLARYRRGRAP